MSTITKLAFLCVLLSGIVLPLAATFPGNCLTFQDGAYITGTGMPTTLTAITLEGWVNHSDLSGSYQRYLTIGNENAVIRLNGSQTLQFYIKNSAGNIRSISSPVMTSGEWLHVAGTYDGTTLRLYLNGMLQTSIDPSPAGFSATDGSFQISRNGEAMHGKMDDFRFWTVVRTQQEIRDNRFSQLTGSEPGLRSYWRMDSTSGTTLIDDQGYSNGTMHGMSSANWLASDVHVFNRIAGNAFSLGTTSYASLKTGSGLPINNNGTASAYSISMWIKGAGGQGNKVVYSESHLSDASYFFSIGTNASGRVTVRIGQGGGTVEKSSNITVFDNTWHHIAWVDNNGTATMYIDGAADGADFSYTRTSTPLNAGTLGAIRNPNANSHFTGQVDELSFWNVALSSSQVLQSMNYPQSLSTTGLRAYFQANESSGNIGYDICRGNNAVFANDQSANWTQSTAPIGLYLSGNVTTDATWSATSQIYVINDVTITNGVTVTIDPGANIYAKGLYAINVQGRIVANGTEQDSIKFTGSPTTRWKGLRYVDTPASNNTSTFTHCSFTYAGVGSVSPENRGSALYVSNFDKINISHSSFRNNRNTDPDGYGGTVYLANASILIHNTEFKNNITERSGGAIYSGGGGSPIIDYCSFIGNQALSGSGGAAFISSGEAQITNCIFRNNSAQSSGGAIYFTTGVGTNNARLTGCILDGNSADQGGAVYYWAGTSGSITITNCTIINNTANQGGGIYLPSPSDKHIRNTILWGNIAGSGNQVYVSGSGPMQFYYCNIQGGLAAFAFANAALTDNYVACFDLDPMISYSESNPGTGYLMSSTSPCINSGNPEIYSQMPTHDVNGNPRFYDNTMATGSLNNALDIVDVGAIEDQNGYAVLPYGSTTIDASASITLDLVLHPGRSLTINPGVTLSFYPDAHALINGSLTAHGTASQMIKFTEAISGSGWRGMTFTNDGQVSGTSSSMQYCIVEKGRSGTDNEAWGGNIHAWYYPSLSIKNSIISQGYASIGGALYSRGSTIDLIGTVISDNVCTSRGTGVYFNAGVTRLISCTIAGNSKTGSQSNVGYIAPVYFNSISTQPVIRNCIVYQNNTTAPLFAESDVTFTNVTYSNIEGGYPGTGNMDLEPGFSGEPDHPYCIDNYSYLINVHDVDTSEWDMLATDIKGNPRIHEHSNPSFNRLDVGAYEHPGNLAPGPMMASDGSNDYPGYVRLTWDFNPNYNIAINGFKVYRNGNQYETLTSDMMAYSDYNVIPGTIYTYHVAVLYFNGETADSHEDNGYIKPNGIISGNIKTPNNNPVKGVKVSLNPSVGYCLHFNAGNSASISIPSPNANMNSNFTLELWTKTTQPNITLFNSGTHTLAINAGLISYTDGINNLIQQDTSISVNDADWHHIAIVNDFTNSQVLMYLDDIVAASSSAYIFGNYVSSSFVIPAGFTGYMDDLRIWEAVRDSSEVVSAMNIVIPYNSPGLKGYWGMNEGTGATLYDATNNSKNGTHSGASWSSADPNIKVGAITDVWGDYVITQIAYGSATTFSVTPTMPGHMFQPEQRLVTLSGSTIAANNVDFIDNSQIPITGYVKFQGTIVPVEGAVIHLNGSPAMPPITSNADGYYVLEVEHGTNCIVSVEYKDHTFNRSWNLGDVTYPRSNINFENTLRTAFNLEVVGGIDSYPIGDFNVSAVSVCGRYTKELTGQNWSTGNVLVPNIPPLNYNVTVNPGDFDPFGLVVDNQFQSMKTKALDLREPGPEPDSLRFEWRAPLQINVAWDDSLSYKTFSDYPDNEFRVLTQNEWYSTVVTAFEDYSYDGHPNQKTYLKDCKIAINDEVGSRGEQTYYFDGEQEFTYTFPPYLPNTQSGYDRQFQNLLEITVRDEDRNRFATQGDWILTQGVRPTESTFATTSPEIPLLILHDPPGDLSQVTFNETNTHTNTLSLSVVTDQQLNASMTMHMGPTFSFSGGTPFFSKETNISVKNDFSDEWWVTASQNNSWENVLTFTTSSELATSDSDDIIGDGADVFMGAAINLVWGITKELYWDYENDDVVQDTSVMVHPDGFDTQYIYTDSQIRNTVIPNLLLIEDTASAQLWQDILDTNEENKQNAVEHPDFPANVSFSAGPSFTLSSSTTKSNTKTFEWDVEVSREFGLQMGHKVDGIGYSGKFMFKAGIKIGGSESDLYEDVTTTTVVLADDDIASDLTFNSDYFTVNIKKDPVYGTPVFELISGASSNHWEPNTMPRDGVMMAANTYTATDIPDGQPAVFLVYLSNTSQTNEPRRYYLEVMHATNNIGATVKINGIPLAERMAFDLEAGQTVTAVLTVEPGPMGYELEGLTLEFYADGDRGYDGPEGHYFDVFKSFSIFWEAPYSRVRIAQPQANWLVNQASENTLSVLLTDYDLAKPDFESIKLEYKLVSSPTWLPALEILRSELEDHPQYIFVPWDVTYLMDGLYEIRACTTDYVQENWYTPSLAGVIDRTSPTVAGLPQPADGILQLGDEISVRFTEAIDPTSILPGSVSMEEVGGVLNLDVAVQFSLNAIYIVPQVSNYWMENRTFRVTVSGLKDLNGNQMAAPIVWEFYVNANPVYWQTSKIELIKPLGDAMSFSTRLINSGGQQSSFAIEDLPNWLTATPMSGILMPLDDELITFTISSQLGFGHFDGTLHANIPSLGREPLKVEVAVLLDPPAWTANVNYNYDNTMTITGQIVIDGVVSQDLNDVIGAFVLGANGEYECRGVANTEYVSYLGGSYQFFLTIYSDTEYDGENFEYIEFRIWDASECKEYYGILEEYIFMDGMIYGTPVSPEQVHVSNNLIRDILLKTGWNWISTNLLNQTSMQVNSVLGSLDPNLNDLIKSQTQHAQYTGAEWVGSLSTIATEKAYKIRLSSADVLTLIGELEDPDTIDISYGTGWNWISYIPHVSISIGEALGNIYNLSTGDMLKSQRAYAQYIDDHGWVGSLRFLNPGEGYMLKTANSGSFTYPEYNLTRSWKRFDEPELRDPIAGWNLNPLAYEFSANITSVLQFNGQVLDQEIILGAFAGSECRGIAEAIQVFGQPMYFLTFYANTMNESISFKAYFPASGFFVDIPVNIPFINNQILGNPLEPYVIPLPSLGLTAPKNLTISMQDGQVMLAWEAVVGAECYNVYSSSDPSIRFEDWDLAAENVNTPYWTKAASAAQKFYRVTACKNTRRTPGIPPSSPLIVKPKPENGKP